ncbi:MAG: hypothetical protein ABEJ03_05230 [Candidatus Nanohaloarchaea archaeon]
MPTADTTYTENRRTKFAFGKNDKSWKRVDLLEWEEGGDSKYAVVGEEGRTRLDESGKIQKINGNSDIETYGDRDEAERAYEETLEDFDLAEGF